MLLLGRKCDHVVNLNKKGVKEKGGVVCSSGAQHQMKGIQGALNWIWRLCVLEGLP